MSRGPASLDDISPFLSELREAEAGDRVDVFTPFDRHLKNKVLKKGQQGPDLSSKELNKKIPRKLRSSGATLRQVDLSKHNKRSLKRLGFTSGEIDRVSHLSAKGSVEGPTGADAFKELRDNPIHFEKDRADHIEKESFRNSFNTAKRHMKLKGVDIESLSPEKQFLLTDISTQYGGGLFFKSNKTGKPINARKYKIGQKIINSLKNGDDAGLKNNIKELGDFKSRNKHRQSLVDRSIISERLKKENQLFSNEGRSPQADTSYFDEGLDPLIETDYENFTEQTIRFLEQE